MIGSSVPDMSRPDLELTGISASMVTLGGASLDEMIRAMGWASNSTFSFLLRHMVLAERKDTPTFINPTGVFSEFL